MKILGFETCNNSSSVALLQDGQIIDQILNQEKQSQSETLVLEIEKILQRNNLWYENLDAVATCKGPASFTGTRISLTCARTISMATKLPIILPNSCEIIAHKYHQKHQDKIPTLVVMQASLVDYFYQFVADSGQLKSDLKPLSENSFAELKFENFSEIFVCGSGQNFFRQKLAEEMPNVDSKKFQFSGEEDLVEAQDICQLSYKIISSGENLSQDLSAIYLNEPRITQRKK